MCDKQRLRSTCAYAQSDQSLCSSLEYSIIVKLLTEHHLEFLSLTLNAPITTKVVCFSLLLKCLRSLYGKQCGPRSDCSYMTSLFWVHTVCSILNSSVMLGHYLQQTTSADDIFRCIFFLDALRAKRRLHRLV